MKIQNKRAFEAPMVIAALGLTQKWDGCWTRDVDGWTTESEIDTGHEFAAGATACSTTTPGQKAVADVLRETATALDGKTDREMLTYPALRYGEYLDASLKSMRKLDNFAGYAKTCQMAFPLAAVALKVMYARFKNDDGGVAATRFLESLFDPFDGRRVISLVNTEGGGGASKLKKYPQRFDGITERHVCCFRCGQFGDPDHAECHPDLCEEIDDGKDGQHPYNRKVPYKIDTYKKGDEMCIVGNVSVDMRTGEIDRGMRDFVFVQNPCNLLRVRRCPACLGKEEFSIEHLQNSHGIFIMSGLVPSEGNPMPIVIVSEEEEKICAQPETSPPASDKDGAAAHESAIPESTESSFPADKPKPVALTVVVPDDETKKPNVTPPLPRRSATDRLFEGKQVPLAPQFRKTRFKDMDDDAGGRRSDKKGAAPDESSNVTPSLPAESAADRLSQGKPVAPQLRETSFVDNDGSVIDEGVDKKPKQNKKTRSFWKIFSRRKGRSRSGRAASRSSSKASNVPKNRSRRKRVNTSTSRRGRSFGFTKTSSSSSFSCNRDSYAKLKSPQYGQPAYGNQTKQQEAGDVTLFRNSSAGLEASLVVASPVQVTHL